jgi:hypothetical protein
VRFSQILPDLDARAARDGVNLFDRADDFELHG